MTRAPPHSYLLRLWREHPSAPLRATLIAVAQPDAPPRHFTSLAALYAYLRQEGNETIVTTDDSNDIHCTPPEMT